MIGSMRFDISLDPTDVPTGRLLDAAAAAEEAGFDGVWLYDHFSGATLGGSSIWDPWPLLGAIAVSTQRILIGPLVANATVRHPAHLAVASATLQDLSGGRFMLGIGAGAGPESSFADEVVMTGGTPRPAVARRTMVTEAIEVIRRLWSGGGEFEGEFYSLIGAVGFPAPAPTPPIVVGANGPKMCEIGGAFGNGVNLHSDEEDLAGLIAITRASASDVEPLITVEAPMERPWLDGHARAEMGDLGVDRLILRWHGAVDRLDAITEAGKRIAAA